MGSSPTRDATKLTRATAFDKNALKCHRQDLRPVLSCQGKEFVLTTLQDALESEPVAKRGVEEPLF